MSFRDLRNFTEMMRALGYNRLISMENFRIPNFTLVAEILIWLVKRFDPDAEVHVDFGTEEDRILLIRSVSQFVALKLSVMLNTKRLYQADGYAVKEILKVTSLLYGAIQANQKYERSPEIITSAINDISSRIQDLKLSRELASRVTTKGAILYELLGKEVELREIRNSSINNQLELNTIENGLKEAITSTKDSITNVKSLIENISTTESSLDSKIEKKKAELERNEKRLQALKKVRPAFLEEFEKLEVELQSLYESYVSRVQSVNYLEHQQDEESAQQQARIQKKQEEARKLMEEMQLEDARKMMEGDIDIDETADLEKETPKPPLETRRLRTATAAKPRLTGQHRVYGSMNVEDEDSIDSDSDVLLDDDGDNSEFMESGDEINGLPLENAPSEQSDDDF